MGPPDFSFEQEAIAQGARLVAGVDEVGRGPLAGPVVAAAVILDPARIPEGMNDSKKLTHAARLRIDAELRQVAQIGIGEASVEEIDTINILQASHLAMRRAIADLPDPPDYLLIDGHILPKGLPCAGRQITKGDARSLSISAASIVAKIRRDYVMQDLAQHYPGYDWDTNVGYPTPRHKAALIEIGVTPHHRRSFKPVHNILYQDKKPTS